MNVISLIFGTIGLLFLIMSVQSNKKGRILVYQIFANIFYGLQYITLGLISAGLMSCVSLFRCFVFYYYEKKYDKVAPMYWFIILTVLPIIISFFTFDGWLSLLPIIGTVLYTYAIWQKNLTVFRSIVTSSSVIWFVYNGIGGAYVSLIGSVFDFVNGVVAIIRYDIIGKNRKD